MRERAPLFLGLARPPKYLGLPVGYLVVLMVGTMVPFVLLKSPWILVVGAVVYPALWVLADREPRYFEILRVSHGAVRGTSHGA